MKFTTQKALFLMRISLLFVIVLLGGVALGRDGIAQDLLLRRVSLRVADVEMRQVLQRIEKQTGVRFLYSPQVVPASRRVSLEVDHKPLSEVLEELLLPQNLSYFVSGRQIVLEKKPSTGAPMPVSNQSQPLEQVVRGRVSDATTGEALPGVNVTIKGTSQGTTTNASGEFGLKVPNEASVLVFSSVGFIGQEVEVGSQAVMEVKLVASNRSLSEVVVVGYGTQKSRDVTGSVARVDPTRLEGLPLTDVSQALQGQVAGVKVRRSGGEPGGEFNVYIRGVNSALGASQPLFVVDGIPLASGALNTLNPDEVESIDVLKDASASAIYGARAANGVVIVTTKMAKKGQPTRISFDVERGIQRAILPFDMTNSTEMAELAKEGFAEGNLTIPPELNDPTFLANNNNNWYDLATRPALYQKYNLQITGGTDKTQFMVAGSYLNNEGVVITTFNRNATLRLSLDHQATNRLKVGGRMSGGYNYGTDFRTGELFSLPWRWVTFTRPWIPHRDADGNFLPIRRVGPLTGPADNPIANLELENRYATQYSFLGNGFAEYDILNGLKLKYMAGVEYFTNRLYDLDPIFDRGDYANTVVNVVDNFGETVNWLSDLTLNYDRTFGKHHLTALGGVSAQKFTGRNVNVTGNGALSNALDQLSGQATYAVSGTPGENGIYSYFGRVFYGFNDRYLITATVRRDGSSRFGPLYRWGTFPSASVGWVVSEESFLKGVNWLSNLKFRASYGLTGNQDIPAFRYIGLVGGANYTSGNALAPGFAVGNPPNLAIRWEAQRQTDIGLDLGLFNNRLTVTADYYNKVSDGLLTNLQLAPSTGTTGTLTKNAGVISNRGWELGINTVNTTGAVKWTTNLNLAQNKNNVEDLGFDAQGNPSRLSGFTLGAPIGTIANLTTAGQPISSFFGYISDGIYQANEADIARTANTLLRPGDRKYRDLNADGKIDANDRAFLGSPHPTFFGGFTNTLAYKGLTLSIFADFATGHSILNVQRQFAESGNYTLWQSRTMLDRWRSTAPSNEYPRMSVSTTSWNAQVSSAYIERGDFVRLNNVTLGYQLPKNLVSKLRLQGASVSLSGNNLHTWTTYTGWNPETNTRADVLSQGLDLGSYPLNRSYIARLSINF